MLSPVVVNIFSLLPLLFTIYLAKRHLSRAKENLYYIWTAFCVILLLFLEIVSFFLEGKLDTWAFVLHMLSYCLEFALTPVVPVLLLLYLGFSKYLLMKRTLLLLPLYLNLLLSTLSIQTGWYFMITQDNIYHRGPFFFFVTIVSAFYYLLAVIRVFVQRTTLCPSKVLISAVFLLPVIATGVQLATIEYSYIFSTMAIALLLYYVTMQECRFAYDLQTRVRNRIAFEQDLHTLENAKKDVAILMCDLNNLKQTNDTWGHQEGDSLLNTLAALLTTTFTQHGKVYRVGGDEFCVLIVLPNTVEILINQFRQALSDLNDNLVHAIDVAYGYAQSDIKHGISLSKAFHMADDAMYKHKALQKKQRLQ